MKTVVQKVALFVFCLMVAVALIPKTSTAKEIELKLASWGPTQHFIAEARQVWIDEVNKTLAGKCKIVDFPGGQLYGPSDIHKAVAKGQVDLGVMLQPAMMGMVPLLQGVYLPFAFENLEAVAKAYSGESLAIIEKALEKKQLKLVYVSYLDAIHIFSNKGNINKVEDLKGLRILSASPMFSEIMATLGAAPDTSIPNTEQYMALKRSVADGVAEAMVGGFFKKAFEVAPYITRMNLSYPTILVCMNLKTWKKLPKDVQDVLLTVGKRQGDYTLAISKAWEQKFTGALAKSGATITTIPPEERAKIVNVSKDIWQKWADKNGKQAKRLLELNIGK